MGELSLEIERTRCTTEGEHATVQVSIREGMTRGETLAEKLTWLESVGLDTVELHTTSLTLPPAELIAAFAASPISVSAIEGIPRLLDADPAQREAAKSTIRERLDLAAKLGAIGVLVVPQFGRVPALPDLAPFATGAQLERNLLLAQLRELAPAAGASGVSLFLEPLNRYEAYIVNRLEQGSAISEEVGPQIGVMADFFHMGIEEADIPAAIRANADHLVYVHVADSNRLQPGRGHLDFRPGFRALKEIGYDGPLAIECRIDGSYDVAIRDTVDLIREEWAKA
ncbi:MAG: sugar phosphate isomerase/epimerase [Chloroflexia bacterium]|nr:sugar phosphate isomerase/epimerase [Chloroflexia bacterium]